MEVKNGNGFDDHLQVAHEKIVDIALHSVRLIDAIHSIDKSKIEDLGTIFLHVDFKNNYLGFCSNYSKALEQYNQIKASRGRSLKRGSSYDLKDDNIMEFHDLFIQPVQRIPRYIMLMQKTLKYIPETTEEYEMTGRIIMRLKEIASSVDETIGTEKYLSEILINNLPTVYSTFK